MSAVAKVVEKTVDFVGDVVESVGNAVGDVVETAGKIVGKVGDAVGKVVENALDDPIGTIAKVATVATGNAWALPLVSAGAVVAQGGSLEDAAKAGALTYVTQGVTNYVAGQIAGAGASEAASSAVNPTVQVFDDGSSIQFFDDGSTLVKDTAGNFTATPATDYVAPAVQPPISNPTVQTFDDGSSIQYFDDGSTLVKDVDGNYTATPAPTEPVAPVAPTQNPTIQTFDDGSSIQTFDDGSTLVTDSEGNVSSTPATDVVAPVAPDTTPGGNPTVQVFDDGSSIQTFDDGSTLVTDSEGNITSTPAPEDIPQVTITDTKLPPENNPTIQIFDDGSSIQTFDDGSTLVTDVDGNVTSTPATDYVAPITTPTTNNPTVQVFDDGSTLQTFDDGSTLATATDGTVTSTPATDYVAPVTTPTTTPTTTLPDIPIKDIIPIVVPPLITGPVKPTTPTDPYATPVYGNVPNINFRPLTLAQGLNPGFIEPTPFYQTTSPVQSKFFWGGHGFQQGPTFNARQYNAVAAPETPFGLQGFQQPLTGQQIQDVVMGRPLPQQPIAPAQRVEQYQPQTQTPTAYGRLAPAMAAVQPVAPEPMMPQQTTQPVMTNADRITQQFGPTFLKDQEAAAKAGDWDTYYQMQSQANSVLNQP